MRHSGLGHPRYILQRGELLSPLVLSLLTAAGIMGLMSAVVIPLAQRFILTPLLFRSVRKKNLNWEDEGSRIKAEEMLLVLKKRLKSSERMNPRADIMALAEIASPPDEQGSVKLNFTFLRLLEIGLMAYEDLYDSYNEGRLLHILLNRKVSWFAPFLQGYRASRAIGRIRFLNYLNRKGFALQLVRLALVPLLGIPGLLLYGIRSLTLRLYWEGTIRNFYIRLMHRSSQYMLYLYGGSNAELEKRRERFSRDEIIRKARHYDRELEIIPAATEREEMLSGMIDDYKSILLAAGLTPDPLYSIRPEAQRKRTRFKKRLGGMLRKSFSAVHGEFAAPAENPRTASTAMELIDAIALRRHGNGEKSKEAYRINQIASAGYKLGIIALGSVYANAPGSRFAMEKLSVELFRKARDFSREPLVSLMAEKGWSSWKSLRPLLKARKLMKIRKVTPAGAAGLGLPIFSRMIQDKVREVILYRLGRGMIRYSLINDDSLPDP